METDIVIQKIISQTGLTKEEIDKKIEDKRLELSGLVSVEGAAYIVAKELGLELFPRTKRRLEIRNIIPGIKNLNLTARVFKIFDKVEFEREGKKSQVVNVLLADGTGIIRLSLWDEQVNLTSTLKPGMAIEIGGSYTKDDGRGGTEIRISKRGSLKLIEESDLPKISDIPETKIKRSEISNIKEGRMYEIRGTIVQIFDSNPFYEICPKCKSRIKRSKDGFVCAKDGKVDPEFSMVLSGVVDDGTGNIRCVFFRDTALKLIGMDMSKALDHFDNLIENISVLGKEFILTGRIRKNQMFDRDEFVVTDVKEVLYKEEIERLIEFFESQRKS